MSVTVRGAREAPAPPPADGITVVLNDGSVTHCRPVPEYCAVLRDLAVGRPNASHVDAATGLLAMREGVLWVFWPERGVWEPAGAAAHRILMGDGTFHWRESITPAQAQLIQERLSPQVPLLPV